MKVYILENKVGSKQRVSSTLKQVLNDKLVDYKKVGKVYMKDIKDLTEVKITKVIATSKDYIIEIK